MAKKVTLSVPDELHEKMNKWRTSINFSKAFQKTIKSIISKKEDFNKRLLEDINFLDALERLKKEKEDFEENYKSIGKKLGIEWSMAAHYTDLLYAVEWMPNEDPTKDAKLGSYFSSIVTQYPFLRTKKIFNEKNENLSKLVSGWKESVNDFWTEIKDKL